MQSISQVNTDPDRPQSTSDYGRMKRNVANSLRRVDTLNIATIFNFPPASMDELRSESAPGFLLLMILEQQGILEESNVDKLEEVLCEVNLEMAVRHVHRYKESLPIPRLPRHRSESSLASEGHETTDDALNERVERPRFKEISGIIQPHDVITFNNQIFILMDGGICAYNMAGKRIRRYQEDGFKPFAATFLDASLFVTDKKSKCVLKFDESLNVKKRFGKSNMTEPAGITSCETRKWIYVLTGRERESAEVAKFTSDGEYLRCYCSDSLEDPWYIKKSSSDEFFISDFARKAVDIYSSDFSNRLYTVNTYKHCRGMDIDDEGNIYIALRDPGYKAQYECFVCYSRPTNGWVTIEESPKPWFRLNQNKSLDFVRGLHYYRCQDNKFLMFADPGNKRLKVISL